MAEETPKTPQTPEEIARAAQAEAMKAVMKTYEQNIEFAKNMMQQAMGDGFMPEDWPDFSNGFDVYADGEITRKGDNSLTPEQNKLLAYGAPLLLYNDDHLDSLESAFDTDTLREMLEEWWDVTDSQTALDTIAWLLNEGHHTHADPALAEIRRRGLEAITGKEKADEDSKIGDAFTISEFVIGVNKSTEEDLPETVWGWDLVRAVNMARWTFICGYIDEDYMWNAIRTAATTAKETFGSWEEYGNSFAVGRGIWKGDTDDYETADELVRVLLHEEDSPWKAIKW